MKSAVTCDGNHFHGIFGEFVLLVNGGSSVTVDGVLTSKDITYGGKEGRDKVATPTWPIVAGVIALWEIN